MTPLTKTFLALMAIAVVVGGTLVLRPTPAPTSGRPQLTEAQLAEMSPKPKPQPSSTVDDVEVPPPPEDSDFEDGNGS